jgi:hypothetical protein
MIPEDGMFILIPEDGTGLAGANSYASLADANAYHLGHLYATKWTTATDTQKIAALVMATRLIDAYCWFAGFRKTTGQALQWPRIQAPDVEAGGVVWPLGPIFTMTAYLPSDRVPRCVIDATSEQARALLTEDRTANPTGEGLKSSDVDGSKFVFDKTDRKPVLTRVVTSMLRRVLAVGMGQARLVRA